MLRIRRIEIEGFGPFADRQVIELPATPGVVVIYGENMRGKTSLLNAIRYAFFGKVLGRGARERALHTLSNRDLAATGKYGFVVSLQFDFNGTAFELVRECIPNVNEPKSDEDYDEDVLLRKENTIVGPQELTRILSQVFPEEVSRFFLFDGELLQEYETLLINENVTGLRISEAIERILGVPILKRGRSHLTLLYEEADKQAGKEAARNRATKEIGTALQQSIELKEAHQAELARLQDDLKGLQRNKVEAEAFMQTRQRYAGLLQERDDASSSLEKIGAEERALRADLRETMTSAWRTILREPVRIARSMAQDDAEHEIEGYAIELKERVLAAEFCDICERDIDAAALGRLQRSLKEKVNGIASPKTGALNRLRVLNAFDDNDNTGEIDRIWSRLNDIEVERVSLRDRINDLNNSLSESDPEAIRMSMATYSDTLKKISVVEGSIEGETKSIAEIDKNIIRWKKTLEASGTADLKLSQLRSDLLRASADTFSRAIESYKSKLRLRVEETATKLFLSMTTEKDDYKGLLINESYGLAIQHKDGKTEDARSAGAEHVVALALMGALQNNAPLRGPIVMDSPFGRLDEGHTSNVVETLPVMAEQVVLLVYKAEVSRDVIRETLKSKLVCEYQMERVSSRRTNIRQVK